MVEEEARLGELSSVYAVRVGEHQVSARMYTYTLILSYTHSETSILSLSLSLSPLSLSQSDIP